MTATSTVILGLQDLGTWSAIGFSLVALVTVVHAIEPFFAWRSRWLLMEDTQYRFYRLRGELTYYRAATAPGQLDKERIKEFSTNTTVSGTMSTTDGLITGEALGLSSSNVPNQTVTPDLSLDQVAW